MKKAFKLAPELSANAIYYSESLVKNDEYKNARKVLQKSFEIFPNQEVFDKYISCGKNLTVTDKMKLAEKLSYIAPESWIAYFGLAKLATQEGMFMSAFQNLLVAYSKEQYDFIADELVKVAENLDNPKPLSAIEILKKPLVSKRVNFVWKCSHCGSEEFSWIAVCKHCNRIGEYHFFNRITENNHNLICR